MTRSAKGRDRAGQRTRRFPGQAKQLDQSIDSAIPQIEHFPARSTGLQARARFATSIHPQVAKTDPDRQSFAARHSNTGPGSGTIYDDPAANFPNGHILRQPM
jgi:hypothetical protein